MWYRCRWLRLEGQLISRVSWDSITRTAYLGALMVGKEFGLFTSK